MAVQRRRRAVLARFLPALALTAALGWAAPAGADPLLYSTSGTVVIDNEPNHELIGIAGRSPWGSVVPIPASSPASPPATAVIPLGDVPITPIRAFADGKGPNGPVPHVDNSPFDVKVTFNDPGLPSLNFQGTLRPAANDSERGPGFDAYVANVTSITSSDPSLNPSLPPPFADVLSNPRGLTVRLGMWDWDINRISLTGYYTPVPEPSTLTIGLAGLAGLGWLGRRRLRTEAGSNSK